jgi:hypothetical protein
MEDDTTRGMDSSIFSHIRRYPNKLVYRPRIAQRKCKLDSIIVTFSFEHENPNIDATLKQIIGVIFIKEPKLELMTEEQ